MTEPAVSFQNVWKSYPSYNRISGGIKSFLFHFPQAVRELCQRRTVLEDVSFEIQKGETFGFIGRNGAGKSTTLGLIAGVLSPEQGKVKVNGRVSPLLELGAGFHPELTGRENILLNGVLLGLTKAEVRECEEEIIEFSELGDFIDQPVRTYSSGMYAKLGFSVISTLKPEILLVDEILSVGDIAFNQKCQKKFEEFRSNRDVTIILVSHSLANIADLCDRVAWMEGKMVKMIGEPANIIKQYEKAHVESPVCTPTVSMRLPTLSVGGTTLSFSSGRVAITPKLHDISDRASLHISLFPVDSIEQPFGQWETAVAPFTLGRDAQGVFDIEMETDTILSSTPGRPCEPSVPWFLGMQAYVDGAPRTPMLWLPLCLNEQGAQCQKARESKTLAQAAGHGFPPYLWPGDKTVRIVARNIAIRDGVGNFVFSMAATLHAYGIPARLYAYTSCPEYAGMVSPICDLAAEMEPDDILYYHYSTEDEFLPDILALSCQKKILYYHNVTPGIWFREYNPELADALERAMCQHSLFSAFDAVVANSHFSLENVLPHIDNTVPAAVFPPTLFPEKLTSVLPEPIQLPDNWRVILWVGRLTPHKRPEMALRLFEELASSHEDAALVMVGGGKHDFPALFSQFEAQLDAFPVAIRERIVLLEGISDAQLAWLYRRACLFLCTSGHEGYCLPVAEALQFGLPVAAMPQKAVEETLGGQGTILPVDVKAGAVVLEDLFARLKDVRIAAMTRAQEANTL